MPQFEVPAGALYAKEYDFLGWYDPATNTDLEALTFTEGEGDKVCLATGLTKPAVGDIVTVNSGAGILQAPRREYALKVCLGEFSNSVV